MFYNFGFVTFAAEIYTSSKHINHNSYDIVQQQCIESAECKVPFTVETGSIDHH